MGVRRSELTTLIVVYRSTIVKPTRYLARVWIPQILTAEPDSTICDRIRARMESSFGVFDF
jgi:hypothetical protein